MKKIFTLLFFILNVSLALACSIRPASMEISCEPVVPKGRCLNENCSLSFINNTVYMSNPDAGYLNRFDRMFKIGEIKEEEWVSNPRKLFMVWHVRRHIYGYDAENAKMYKGYEEDFPPPHNLSEHIFMALNIMCPDLKEVTPVLKKRYHEWIGRPLQNNLLMENWLIAETFDSSKLDKEIQNIENINNDYNKCRYYDYEVIGNTLIYETRVRPYCFEGSGWCEGLVKSDFVWIYFVFTHPSDFPYDFFGYIGILLFAVVGIVYLVQKGLFIKIFKPNRYNVIAAIALPFLWINFVSIFFMEVGILAEKIVELVILFYALGSFIRYFIKNKSPKK